MLNAISVIIIPFIVGTILLYGWLKGEDIYSLFIEGAKEGLKTSIKIMPYLIAIFIAVGIFRASGAMNMMQTLFEPVNKILKIPEGILPLIIIRPISGVGTLGARFFSRKSCVNNDGLYGNYFLYHIGLFWLNRSKRLQIYLKSCSYFLCCFHILINIDCRNFF